MKVLRVRHPLFKHSVLYMTCDCKNALLRQVGVSTDVNTRQCHHEMSSEEWCLSIIRVWHYDELVRGKHPGYWITVLERI